MSDNLNEILEKLENLLGTEDIQEIESCISTIALLRNSSAIGRLLVLLDDSYNYDEVMYSIIHAAEDFSDSTYVSELLDALPLMCEQSPEWTSIVVMRVLNSDSTRAELAKTVLTASTIVKSSMEWILNEINKESPEFLAKTIAILAAVKSS